MHVNSALPCPLKFNEHLIFSTLFSLTIIAKFQKLTMAIKRTRDPRHKEVELLSNLVTSYFTQGLRNVAYLFGMIIKILTCCHGNSERINKYFQSRFV